MPIESLTLTDRVISRLSSAATTDILSSLATLHLGVDVLDKLGTAELAELIETTLDLRDYSCDQADASHTAQWVEPSEKKTWDLPCYALRVGSSVALWSCTDEAGVADLTILDAEDDLAAQVRDFAEELAADLGTLIEASKAADQRVEMSE